MNLTFVSCQPAAPLVDGDLELSLPGPADTAELAAYGAHADLLEGIWVAGPPPAGDPAAWARQRIDEFRAGWQSPGGPQGAVLSIRSEGRLVGFVYLSPRGASSVEVAYGIAPPARGRGLATRAAKRVTRWLLTEGGFDRVLLYVDEDHAAGHRVAVRAGFRPVDSVRTRIEATGESFTQIVYESV